eukprot:1192790-Prorocentrum_minimum.AAC.3
MTWFYGEGRARAHLPLTDLAREGALERGGGSQGGTRRCQGGPPLPGVPPGGRRVPSFSRATRPGIRRRGRRGTRV